MNINMVVVEITVNIVAAANSLISQTDVLILIRRPIKLLHHHLVVSYVSGGGIQGNSNVFSVTSALVERIQNFSEEYHHY
jgi:hypothetical protein